jgi:hypothetical protein
VQDPDGMTELARFGHVSTTCTLGHCGQPDADVPKLPRFTLYDDAKRQFCSRMGRQAGVFLIRQHGYIRLARPVVRRAELDRLSGKAPVLAWICGLAISYR